VTTRRSGRASVLARRRGATAKGTCVKGHESCVCLYVGVRVVRWTGGIQVSMRRNERRKRTLPTQLRARRAALRRRLDGALSAASARSAGQATRGFVVKLLALASRLEQRWAAVEQRAASTRCFTARGGDAMAHDGRWTGRH
jgi:hypothetical protein